MRQKMNKVSSADMMINAAKVFNAAGTSDVIYRNQTADLEAVGSVGMMNMASAAAVRRTAERKNKRKNRKNHEDLRERAGFMEHMRRMPIFEDMPDMKLDHIIDIAKPFYADYGKCNLLVNENEVFSSLVTVISGKFISVRNDRSGKSAIIREYAEGEMIGLDILCSKGMTSPTTIEAASGSRVLVMDIKALLAPTYPDKRLQYELQNNLMKALADDAVKNIYKIDIVTKRTIRERVLAYLLLMAKKKQSFSFHVGMDREHMAQFLDVTRSALSHELSKMRDEGLITFDRDWFELSDTYFDV